MLIAFSAKQRTLPPALPSPADICPLASPAIPNKSHALAGRERERKREGWREGEREGGRENEREGGREILVVNYSRTK
jgi:hypothetical protein